MQLTPKLLAVENCFLGEHRDHRVIGSAEHFHTLQVLGNYGEVLGAITYSVSTHCPVPSAQQAAQRVQQPWSQAQLESQQHDFSLHAAVTEDDRSDSSSSSSSVTAIQTASLGGQSQLGSPAAADAVSDAGASQDSTALTAFGTHRRTGSKHDKREPLPHVQQGTEAVSGSLDEDLVADSLVPSSSGVLFGTMPQHLDVCSCRSATVSLLHCVCV